MIEIETIYKPAMSTRFRPISPIFAAGSGASSGPAGSRSIPTVAACSRPWLDQVKNKVNPPPPPANLPAGVTIARTPHDVQAIMRAELKTLDAQVAAAQGKAGDAMTRAHLADVRAQIDRALNPKS